MIRLTNLEKVMGISYPLPKEEEEVGLLSLLLLLLLEEDRCSTMTICFEST